MEREDWEKDREVPESRGTGCREFCRRLEEGGSGSTRSGREKDEGAVTPQEGKERKEGARLPGTASDPFDFEFAFDGVSLGVIAGGEEEFIGDAFLKGVHVIEGSPRGSGSEVREGEVNAALGSSIDGGMIDNAPVGDASRFFAGGSIIERGEEDLEGVLASAGVDKVESMFHDIIEEVFFPSVFATYHEAVNEAFHDMGIGFPEAFVGVPAKIMESERGLQGDIALEARIGYRALTSGPFIKEEEVLRIVNQSSHQIMRDEALRREGLMRRVRRA